MSKQILFLFMFLSLIACSNSNKQSVETYANTHAIDSTYTIHYAKGFDVNVYEDCKQVIVKDPWDSTKVLQKYVLVDKDKPEPSELPEGTLIRTPLSNVVVYSAIQASTIDAIGASVSIKGVCDPQYIEVASVMKGIDDGRVTNLGQASNPNKELLIALQPEAVFIEPMSGKSNVAIENMGVTVIETPDYMELTPLGRAEWIRFYSLFYNNEAYVDSLFDQTVTNYDAIKAKTANVAHRPTVFFDMMYRGVWYVSGGASFISEMIDDAGASYLWHDSNTDYLQLSFEQVLDKAVDADFWLIKYNGPQMFTYQSMQNEYKPYNLFKAFKENNVYLCNTAKNTYFQDLPIHPDYILQDFAYVFHPELFPDYKPKYYQAMH